MKNAIKKDFKFWLNVVTIAALVVLVIISRHQIAGVFRNFDELNGIALVLMIPLQLVNYYSIARFYKDFFASQGERLETKTLYPVALEMNFVNNVFPSGGVSGFSYLSRRLKRYGISTAKSSLAQILRFSLTFVSFLLLLFIGMVVLAFGHQTSPLTILISSTIASLTLFGVLISVFIISDERRVKSFTAFLPKAINRVIRFLRRGKQGDIISIEKVESTMTDLHQDYMILSRDWRQLKKPLLWTLLINISELSTIYVVYIAFGSLINPGALIIAYAVANFAGLVAVLPGGVGIYEGLMTAVLASAGVAKALALSATVVYRVLNMMLFLPIGYIFYHRALKYKSDTNEPSVESN